MASRKNRGTRVSKGKSDGYCVKCRAPRQMANASISKSKNGRSMKCGKCVKCGTKMCRFLGKTAKM